MRDRSAHSEGKFQGATPCEWTWALLELRQHEVIRQALVMDPRIQSIILNAPTACYRSSSSARIEGMARACVMRICGTPSLDAPARNCPNALDRRDLGQAPSVPSSPGQLAPRCDHRPRVRQRAVPAAGQCLRQLNVRGLYAPTQRRPGPHGLRLRATRGSTTTRSDPPC